MDRLEEAEQKKAEAGIRFMWSGDLDLSDPGIYSRLGDVDVLVIFGVTKKFRSLGGIPKLGEFLLKEGY